MGFSKTISCFFFVFLFFQKQGVSQSLEIMVGNKNVFANAQWFKFLDTTGHLSVFTRGFGNIDYEGNSDLFLGTYINYTTKSGLGATIIGRIGTFDSGGDAGAHFMKFGKNWGVSVFATVGVGLLKELQYSVFSNLEMVE
ncbi:MAG: hypothetical protein GY810_12320 [Aureispira sp.]|nr:hypothetical protein [Aureispira sp.]